MYEGGRQVKGETAFKKSKRVSGVETEVSRITVIDETEVDIGALYSITYRCTPGVCSKSQCCCAGYEVCIDRHEMSNLIGYMPEASTYASYLRAGAGYENVFEELGPGLFAIDTNDDDICAFSYLNKKDEVLCALHTVALELNLPPHEVKPKSCTTWPLAVSEEKPVRLSISEDAFNFPCNTPRKETESLDPNIAQIIHDIFGEEFLKKVEETR